MTQINEIYKCEVCGNIVEIVHSGEGELYCCSKPMKLLYENTNDMASSEKHVPVFEDCKIKVGSLPHPMIDEHYIEFIEAISPDKKYIIRKYLTPNEEPTMDVSYDWGKDTFIMREFCNIHGVWKSNKE